MVATRLLIDFTEQAVTRRELLAHIEYEGYVCQCQIVQELSCRNSATNENVRGTCGTMFDFTKSEFEDQWKSIMMPLDRTNVLNDEFGENAKEATERVSASPADLQRWQQEGADHLQAQLTDNS